MGETIRIWAVSYAGGQTRTRRVGAPALCSSGPFAFVRNPLYLGNMLMYAGIVLIAGSANVWLMVATTVSFFLIQYSLIISLEEETLTLLFGEEYEEYKNNVPGVFPRISRWETRDDREPSNFLKTLKTERRTLQNVVLILILIFLRIQVFS
jgi:protein-S-isoprenylcysteine O-methyltransferase Ste14